LLKYLIIVVQSLESLLKNKCEVIKVVYTIFYTLKYLIIVVQSLESLLKNKCEVIKVVYTIFYSFINFFLYTLEDSTSLINRR